MIEEEHCIIPLTKGQFALVDPDMYVELSRWRWNARWSASTQTFYAVRNVSIEGKFTTFYMHREVLGLKKGDSRVGDHREPSQTLDNRRANLRIATHSQNRINQRIRSNNLSGYKGVSFHSGSQKYAAQISVNGKRTCLGYRDTAKAAHFELYVPAANMLHGEFVRI